MSKRPSFTWTPDDDQPPRWPYRESIWLEYVCLLAGVLAVVVALAIWGVR